MKGGRRAENHIHLAVYAPPAQLQNYVDYIAGRPRVERIGEHGLFTDAGVPVVLAQVQDLLRSKKAMLCKHMKIDSENLRWYCAFHNENHHPHVHLMVYSSKDNDGFLTEPAIEAMRSELAHDIFRQDFAHIYEQQNTGGKKVYGYLKADVKAIIDRIVDELAKDERIDKLYRAWGAIGRMKFSAPTPPSCHPLLRFPSRNNLRALKIW